MRIKHIAIWTRDLEGLKDFYETWFEASGGPKYVNPDSQFASYFLSFPDGARLELMQSPRVSSADRHPDVVPLGLRIWPLPWVQKKGSMP